MERCIENLFIWQESRVFVNAIYKMKMWNMRYAA